MSGIDKFHEDLFLPPNKVVCGLWSVICGLAGWRCISRFGGGGVQREEAQERARIERESASGERSTSTVTEQQNNSYCLFIITYSAAAHHIL